MSKRPSFRESIGEKVPSGTAPEMLKQRVQDLTPNESPITPRPAPTPKSFQQS